MYIVDISSKFLFPSSQKIFSRPFPHDTEDGGWQIWDVGRAPGSSAEHVPCHQKHMGMSVGKSSNILPFMRWISKNFPGWWFGTKKIFSHILGIIIPIDFHIFQRGGPTTNQFLYVGMLIAILMLRLIIPILSHGSAPIAGWFLFGKSPIQNGWWLGGPLF